MNLAQFRAQNQLPRCCWACHKRPAVVFDRHYVYEDGTLDAKPLCRRCFLIVCSNAEPKNAEEEILKGLVDRQLLLIEGLTREGGLLTCAESCLCRTHQQARYPDVLADQPYQ